jgi:non-specific serine/threonine protein kinase/serine/threonine-protein kinase
MTRDQWQRVKQVAAAALDLPTDARQAYIIGACAGDEACEREVVSLLESAALAEPLFEGALSLSPAVAAALDDAAGPASIGVGARIAQYRIVREIGRGGMGRVFLAERADDEYRQRVALKVAHVRSPDVLRWFRDERQILATLHHPHIARLMDGGTTADGVPYLVMEYIEGAPIDEYCSANGLSVAERLTLFQQVCLAIDFAHRHLVVHRDLKPRNILVANGEPKVLDFGIAKLMAAGGQADAGGPRGSNTGPGMLTPEYASPEQLRGVPVTTATDVYALGVLLYRLLTGAGPYQLTSDAPHELAAAILEQDPVPPSANAGSRQLRRQLAGDLDTIALTALKKDPVERYASAALLAEDVRRHLQRLPIAARRDAVGYRVRRFVARHTLAVAAAALIVLSLAGGLAATAQQARETELQRARAQRHFDDVRKLASSLIFEVHDGIENVPGTIQTRQLLVNRAVEYFDGLAAEERDNVDLQRELAEAYDRLGNVLGRPYSANLGETTAALASYRKALDIRERLAAVQPGDRRLQLDLWSSYYNVGGLLRETGDTRGALLLHEKARAIVEPLLVAAGDDEALLRSAAQSASTLSVTYAQAGRVRDGLAAARAALDFDERLLARDPANTALRQDLASVHGRIGMFLMKLGDLDGAEPHFREGLELAVGLVFNEPANVTFQRRLSNGHSHLAHLNGRRNALDVAWDHQQTALTIRQKLVAQNPADRQASIDLMVSQIEAGDVNVRRGELAAAMDRYRTAIDTAESLVAGDPRYVYYRLTLASGLTRLAQASIASGRPMDARSLLARAIELTRVASDVDPADVRLRFELALAHGVTGDMAAAIGDTATAHAEYQTAVSLMTALRDAGQLEGGTLNGDESKKLAELERKLGMGAMPRVGR